MSARGINKVILVGRLAMIRKSVTSPTGRSGKPAGGYVRKLARQTDGGDAGADGMAPRGAVRQARGSGW
ncbi:Uncharacterised protein [Escherichia coli]|nr:Uncharacterised protein [Escherichia coli]